MVDPVLSMAATRIVRLLVGQTPQSVADLVDATGVTRTAVTEQLNELVAAGLVQRTTERLTGRGRPRNLYAACGTTLQLMFANAHQLAVPAMWRAIDEVGGKELTAKIVSNLSKQLAEYYKAQINGSNPDDRLRQFCGLLGDEGGLVDLDEEKGHPVMYKRNCPFIGILDENRTICSVDMEMMADIVGHPIVRVACRLEGTPCCIVKIADD